MVLFAPGAKSPIANTLLSELTDLGFEDDKLKPKGYSTYNIRFFTIVVEFEFISIVKSVI